MYTQLENTLHEYKISYRLTRMFSYEITNILQLLHVFTLDKKVVAFDVRLTKPIKNLAAKGRVIFGMVELNEGKGYDPLTGIFTAPASGIYVFDWTTLAEQGKTAYTSLVVNGKFTSWNHCRSDISNIYLSCSKMTVAKLKQGNKVWIGVYTGSTNMYEQFTSFSGYKL